MGKRDDPIYGSCDHPQPPHRKLYLQKNLDSLLGMEIAIHEGTHACFWDIDEEAIAEAAHDVARFLWNLGYRHKDDEGDEDD